MKLECLTHSNVVENPPRHYVDGRPVTSDAYWNTFDGNVGAGGYRHSMVDRDEPEGQRSRISTFDIHTAGSGAVG